MYGPILFSSRCTGQLSLPHVLNRLSFSHTSPFPSYSAPFSPTFLHFLPSFSSFSHNSLSLPKFLMSPTVFHHAPNFPQFLASPTILYLSCNSLSQFSVLKFLSHAIPCFSCNSLFSPTITCHY